MKSHFIGWVSLRKAMESVYPKATLGLVLIYIVYFLKKGGFDTVPLEITLTGCLFVIAAMIMLQLAMPSVVAKHHSPEDYEFHVHKQIHAKYVPSTYYHSIFSELTPRAEDAVHLGYTFDKDFSFSIADIKSTLGDAGALSFIARLHFMREDLSRKFWRCSVFTVGIAGLLMMYWRPMSMLMEIYTK